MRHNATYKMIPVLWERSWHDWRRLLVVCARWTGRILDAAQSPIHAYQKLKNPFPEVAIGRWARVRRWPVCAIYTAFTAYLKWLFPFNMRARAELHKFTMRPGSLRVELPRVCTRTVCVVADTCFLSTPPSRGGKVRVTNGSDCRTKE
jgi:hypothetical protein